MMKIEKANKNDIPAILALYVQLFEHMSKLQAQSFKKADQDKTYIEKAIESDEYAVIVAKDNDNVVGFILAIEQNTPPYNCYIQRRLVYIYDIVVDTSYRGKGVGKLLMAEIESWATQRKVEYIELSVLAENTSASKLYEELGYKNTIQTKRKSLK